MSSRIRKAKTALQLLTVIALVAPACPTRVWANDVVINGTIKCSTDLGCADVYEVKCPKASRYLCADLENTATFNANENHTFFMSTVGTTPNPMLSVAAMTAINAKDSDGACLTKPVDSPESPLKGLVTITRAFGGQVALDGPDTYRLTAFCVSDDTGAGPTAVTMKQDQ